MLKTPSVLLFHLQQILDYNNGPKSMFSAPTHPFQLRTGVIIIFQLPFFILLLLFIEMHLWLHFPSRSLLISFWKNPPDLRSPIASRLKCRTDSWRIATYLYPSYWSPSLKSVQFADEVTSLESALKLNVQCCFKNFSASCNMRTDPATEFDSEYRLSM